ncbi:MAG TPA: hypothetical protein VFG14_08625, partial [Chthoniobacteraceae bacterium]|nr:hypothetical protein [Chthoniobacteraceae bacterium]
QLCRPYSLPRLLALKEWSPRQKVLLEEMHGSLIAARERRQRLRRMMALEIEEQPDFLRLYVAFPAGPFARWGKWRSLTWNPPDTRRLRNMEPQPAARTIPPIATINRKECVGSNPGNAHNRTGLQLAS